MSYLIQSDFKKQIQTDNLNQIIGNDQSVLNAVMLTAQEEVISYLVQKYDTTTEFADINAWDSTKTYNVGDRFYLDAAAYNPQQTYSLNSLCLYNGSVFICTSAITVAEAFNATHWTLLGTQYAKFYAALPSGYIAYEYNSGNYTIGSKIFYKGYTYTALKASIGTSYDDIIQGDYVPVSPYSNIFPDDPVSGATYWGIGTSYNVPAATFPINTTYYTLGDNRSQQILTCMIDVALYHVHSRIAPRNIPELRVKRYDDAIKWLKMAAKGDITPNLPVLQPAAGSRIRWASQPKQRNNY